MSIRGVSGRLDNGTYRKLATNCPLIGPMCHIGLIRLLDPSAPFAQGRPHAHAQHLLALRF